MNKIKGILKSWRVWLLIIFVVLAVVAIGPKFSANGVLITGVEDNSSAAINGVKTGEIIELVDGQTITDIDSYGSIISDVSFGDIIKITTDKSSYSFVVEEQYNVTYLGITIGEVPTSNIKTGLDLIGGVRVLLEP